MEERGQVLSGSHLTGNRGDRGNRKAVAAAGGFGNDDGRRDRTDAKDHGVAARHGSYVFMMFLPALRSLTLPFPPGAFAARFLAAVIRPPLLFFMGPILSSPTAPCVLRADCHMQDNPC